MALVKLSLPQVIVPIKWPTAKKYAICSLQQRLVPGWQTFLTPGLAEATYPLKEHKNTYKT
jgi:hypothetical protein